MNCFAKFCYDHHLTDKKVLNIETKAGLRIVELIFDGDEVVGAKVDMQEPILNCKDIPVIFDQEKMINEKVMIGDQEYALTTVSMGNPHVITYVDSLDFDIEKITKRLSKKDVKLVEIQRSRGYSTRKSLEICKIENVIKEIRKVNKDVIIMVDNCYGEFVEEKEPIEVGADIAVGSLMKNLGAGIATSGAYIVGKRELVEMCAQRLTAPGIGKEIGPSLNQNTLFLKGLFFAPSVVASSLKTAIFASAILEELGYNVEPKWNEKRADIVQTISLGSADKLIKFCQGIQKGSPIDSNVIPEPGDMG